MQDLKCFRHSMQTASEASSPQHDDVRSARVTSPSSVRGCHGDHVNTAASAVTDSVHDGQVPSPFVVVQTLTAAEGSRSSSSAVVSSCVPLAVLEEFGVGGGGGTDNEVEAPAPPPPPLPPDGSSSSARCRRSQFSSSRRKKQPLTTSNGPVSSPPVPPPGSTEPPLDAVIVDMNSNDKDNQTDGGGTPSSPSSHWARTLDDDDDTLPFGDDDIGNYDADDAMLEFAERYFNAQPAQFSYSALVRTVSIVTRKSLNVSVRFFFI